MKPMARGVCLAGVAKSAFVSLFERHTHGCVGTIWISLTNPMYTGGI